MRTVTPFLLALLLTCSLSLSQVRMGIDVLRDDGFNLLEGKRVGLVANPASVDANLTSTVELFHAKNIKLVSLFGPEHGIHGNEYAGDKVEDRTDPVTGVPIYSLYGKTRRPTTQMIQPLEALVFDLQDLGARSYTYISTLKTTMEACAEHDIEMVVLDRPNPLGGERIEGPMLLKGFESFVGMINVPYLHGMTMGELAQFVRDLHYPNFKKLTIVKMSGWKRPMVWSEIGRPWVPTSPHIPKQEVCTAYAATGILGELYAVSIGVGYTLPFELIGAPWLDGEALARALPQQKGVTYRPVVFKPFYGTFKGEVCQGVQVHLDPKTAESIVETNYRLIELLGPQMLFAQAEQVFQRQEDELATKEKRAPKKVKRYEMFDKVSGSDEPRKWLLEGRPLDELFARWRRDCDAFRRSRQPYLLY